ncbi:hypothetical protein KPL71_011964 [Citrus sinensis]|uniref:Uncharacterized protein n=1 Tax=Citrus sinensis TaxID=2711 RepID=A0ACB8L7A4_CITSI|nr:hypothetical protein KPL71_011964 [Citrus sinensis]
MLDTRFTHYQDVVIGTVLTTLHVGSVLLTFYPNFNLSLQDTNLSTALKVQVQIQAVQTAQEKLPITGFNSEGYHVYPAKLNGHFLWDSPGSGNCDPDCPCWDDWEEDDVEPQRRRKPKKKIPKTPCSHNQTKPPHNPPLPPSPLPIYQKELTWIAKNCKTKVLPHIQNSKPPIQPMAYPSDTDQTSYSNLAVLEDSSESETESSLESSLSSRDSEKSYADITRILMAQPEETEPAQSSRTDPFFKIPSDIEEDPPEASSAPNRPAQPQNDHKPSNGPWFTFDDIPVAKWRDRLSEMAAWTYLQMLRANATPASVLRELATRFTGSLRDWFDTLREYKQLQFVQLPNVSTALSVIHEQFIRESAAVFEATRRDYLNMKCCSLNSKDLDFHYKQMSILFYKLNGLNDPTLKHVFLASLPEKLQPDIQRQLTSLNLTIDNISLGKILSTLPILMATFFGIPPDPEIVTQIVPVGMIGKKMMFNHSEEENQKRKYLKLRHLEDPKPFEAVLNWQTQNARAQNETLVDIHKKIKHLQIIPTGIRVKFMFKPFTNVLKLYGLSETSQPFQDISTKLLKYCPESHADFHHPNPLWKNPHFFVQLPFKLNEDVNPTKATHPGMSPFDLVLAQKECSQLLAQGTQDDDRHLLNQFFDIIQSHGIMLSTKKSTIATNNIEFLRMTIKDGHYQPGKHIAQELIHFPDQNLTKRQI